MNIEKLKQLAEEFKEPIELAIEKTKEYDLIFISSVERSGRRFTEREINGLKSNLHTIQRHHDELRLIDEFVDYCESQSLESTARKEK